MRAALPLLLALAAAPASCKAKRPLEPSELTFAVPEGWVDLSPGAPEGNFKLVPPDVAQDARAEGIRSFSVTPPEVGGRSGACAGTVQPGGGPITDARIDEVYAASFTVPPASSPLQVAVRERSRIKLGGHDVGRFVVELTSGGQVLVETVTYLVPGRKQTGVVKCSFPAGRAETYRPAVEAAVEKMARSADAPAK